MQVEAALMSSNYVDNIMAYADSFKNYCVALVVPSHQALEKWAQQVGIKYQDFAELCNKDETIAEVQQSLSKVSLFSACLLEGYRKQYCLVGTAHDIHEGYYFYCLHIQSLRFHALVRFLLFF